MQNKKASPASTTHITKVWGSASRKQTRQPYHQHKRLFTQHSHCTPLPPKLRRHLVELLPVQQWVQKKRLSSDACHIPCAVSLLFTSRGASRRPAVLVRNASKRRDKLAPAAHSIRPAPFKGLAACAEEVSLLLHLRAPPSHQVAFSTSLLTITHTSSNTPQHVSRPSTSMSP